MMAKDPSARFQDYEPLIRDLESAKIHRLAKERRMTNDMSEAPTMVMAGHDDDGGYTTELEMALPGMIMQKPSSYLSEGLVDVNFESTDTEPHTSGLKIAFLSLAGLAIIGFAAIFLLQPVSGNDGTSQTRLSAGLVHLMGKSDTALSPPKNADQLVQQDMDNIQVTKSRMEAIVSRVIQMRQSDALTEVPTVKMLREKKIFSEAETRDAWGNDFYIISSGSGGGTLVALGRDGQDKTADDFTLTLDGQSLVVPPALRIEKAQEKVEPGKH
jgi:hypothetical protein